MILKLIYLLNLINFTEKCGNFWKKNHSTGSLLNVTTLNGSQLLYTQQHNIYSSLVHWPTLRHELSKRHTHQRSLSHMHLICIYAMRASGKTQTSSRFSISTQFQIHQLRWHSTSCHRLCNSQSSATFKWIFLVSSILVFVNWTQFKLSSTVFYVAFIYFFLCEFHLFSCTLCCDILQWSMMATTNAKSNIRVVVKARPLIKREKSARLSTQWRINDNTIECINPLLPNVRYTFG